MTHSSRAGMEGPKETAAFTFSEWTGPRFGLLCKTETLRRDPQQHVQGDGKEAEVVRVAEVE